MYSMTFHDFPFLCYPKSRIITILVDLTCSIAIKTRRNFIGVKATYAPSFYHVASDEVC